jgi:hypothetical protein
LCFGAGNRHAVEQRGAFVHADHAAAVAETLRKSETRRTLGEGAARRPIELDMRRGDVDHAQNY